MSMRKLLLATIAATITAIGATFLSADSIGASGAKRFSCPNTKCNGTPTSGDCVKGIGEGCVDNLKGGCSGFKCEIE